jgi:hypothetical protein
MLLLLSTGSSFLPWRDRRLILWNACVDRVTSAPLMQNLVIFNSVGKIATRVPQVQVNRSKGQAAAAIHSKTSCLLTII